MNHEIRPLTHDQKRLLMTGLNPARVANRRQGGTNLSYLESYDVKATLIRVFGFGGFSAEVIQSEVLYKEAIEKSGAKGAYTQWKVAVQSTVQLTIHQLGAVYTETAVGDGTMGDISEAMDKAIKTASSDALKRCAIYLGTQFGLSLYNNGSTQEVIRMIAAPGQRWWNNASQEPEDAQPAPQQEPEAQQSQEPPQQAQESVERHPGVTDEQHQANIALTQQAVAQRQLQDQLNAQPVQQQ